MDEKFNKKNQEIKENKAIQEETKERVGFSMAEARAKIEREIIENTMEKF